MKKLFELIGEVLKFLTHDIWHYTLGELPRTKSFLVRQLRIIVLAVKGFRESKVNLRASALTFYTILSVVPVIAMIFAISKGFGIQDVMKEKIVNFFQQYEEVQGHHEVINWILSSAENFIGQARGGFIAGAGLILLLYSVMKLLGHIESSFNDIWQIRTSRSWARKFSDYLSILLIAPVFIFLSSSVTYFISEQFHRLTEMVPVFVHLRFLLGLIPYVLVWFLLTMIYMVMPNTTVKFSSAFVAGIIAGTIFQLTQWGYMQFQVGVNRYGAIYGSFAAIPLFVIWIQVSWLIVLIGAEISFANQNVSRYEFESEIENVSTRYKRILALLMTSHAARRFEHGEPPLTAAEMTEQLKVPVRAVRDILFELVEAGILSETYTGQPKERAYQPAMDIGQLTASRVMEALDRRGSAHTTVSKTREFNRISEMLDRFQETLKQNPENILLKDI